jgi:hypothetical protein
LIMYLRRRRDRVPVRLPWSRICAPSPWRIYA